MRRLAAALTAVLLAATPAAAADTGAQDLSRAVGGLERLLAQTSRERTPLNWASLQNHLGLTLYALARGEDGTARLAQAAAAFRAALEERRRDRVPLDWAVTQSNLGHVLTLLAERDPDRTPLRDALQCFDAAFQELTLQRAPLDWARALGGQAIALMVSARDQGDLALARRARDQIDRATAVFRARGFGPLSAPYRARRAEAEALVDALVDAVTPPRSKTGSLPGE